MIQSALSKLKEDPKLAKLLLSIPLKEPKVEQDIYLVLLRSIVGQQLSTKAAATIWDRFLKIFPERYPEPNVVLRADVEMLRNCGLSYQKAGYIRNIASFSLSENLSDEFLSKMNDSEILAYVSQIKGVGKWTVEMILMFALGREDVFPVDDLGVRNGMIKLYGVTSTGKLQKAELEQIAKRWSPYRSYACMLLWDWKDEK